MIRYLKKGEKIQSGDIWLADDFALVPAEDEGTVGLTVETARYLRSSNSGAQPPQADSSSSPKQCAKPCKHEYVTQLQKQSAFSISLIKKKSKK